jgi:hypothetical protein
MSLFERIEVASGIGKSLQDTMTAEQVRETAESDQNIRLQQYICLASLTLVVQITKVNDQIQIGSSLFSFFLRV